MNFEDVFLELETMGVFDWLLPFLLVFVVIFAVLEKTAILGTEGKGGPPRKNLNVVFAFLIALILVVQTRLVIIMNTYLSKMALFIIIALVALLAIGVFTGSGSLRGWPMIIGVILGLVGGYFGGITEKSIFSIVDLLLSMPSLLLAIAIVATLGPGIWQVMTAVGISLIPIFARVTRGSVLTVKEQNYVLAAKALGASRIDIMVRHILPNILTPIIVMATLNCAFAIIMEVALSFLGIGIQPPEPTWGLILSNGWQQMRYATWISTFSGLAITITVLGFNLLGDGLRDLMDPTMRRVMQSE